MAKKSDVVAKLIAQVEPAQKYPTKRPEGMPLVDLGAVVTLMGYLTETQALQSVAALRAAYVDWNEARVSQVQELAQHLRTSSRKKGTELLNDRKPAATALKTYLQDVFQETHGLDLEFLGEDPVVAGKAIASFKHFGLTSGAYLMWAGNGGNVPVHSQLIKILDKLGLIAKTTSISKATDSISKIVPGGKELGFTLAMHEILARWNDEEAPIYTTCKALQDIPYGKKAHKDWVASQARLAAQREREEARRIANEKREAERLRKEEERERKRLEAEQRRLEREAERQRKAIERKKAAEQKKREAEKKKAAAKKKAEQEKKRAEAARKKAAAKKKADAAKKKAAAAKKKAADAKKKAKTASKKKAARKPAAKKKAASKKAASRKKPVAKKKAAKKPAAKKKAAKKPAAKKKATKKTTARKKTASKKKAVKKKTARKKTTRR